MSFFVIGDEETVLGFKLAGVPGKLARNEKEARESFQLVSADSEVKIIIVNEKIAEKIRKELDEHSKKNEIPLIIEVPDKDGPFKNRPELKELLKASVGIKI